MASTPPSDGRSADAAAQESRGNALYAKTCAECHGQSLGGGKAPQLAGDSFRSAWKSKDARALYRRILSTMPATDPGSLTDQEALDITSYLMNMNGVSAGPFAGPGELDGKPLSP